MAVKATRSEHLLTLKGNRWWFRQGIPKPVHKVTGGSSFIMINLGTSDIREAGKSLREIAAELNKASVQTASGGEWQASQIKRVIERLEA